jgi:pimeloyl-ACP methyl ester carboxylesterase/AraC-like DNA-binding protein
MKPPIQYTKSGVEAVSIAYQVFGSGPIDIVYIPGWVSNIDWMWACPELVDFFETLGKIARVILFDKRGTGLSDRAVEFSTLEERMEDIKAVMDAVDSKKAILFGHSEGGSVSALFSATYPNRVTALIAFGIFAKRRYSLDYPWAPTDQERQKVYNMIENSWGSGEMNLETLVPSKANDPVFMDWLANYFRSGASPTAAMKLTKTNTQVNIIDILGYINVPTLLMQRTNDIDVKIEEGRFIAEHIKGSKFVEFEGDDHLFWVGNTVEVLDQIKMFIKTLKPSTQKKKGICTMLFGEVFSSTRGNLINEMIHQYVNECGGFILKNDKKHFIAAFQTPGKAVHCSIELLNNLEDVKTSFSMGIYLAKRSDIYKETLNKRDEYMMQSMRSQLNYSHILATQTIKHLLTGSEFNFTEDSSVLEYGSYNLCKLYSVSKVLDTNKKNTKNHLYNFTQYNSFLEDVLQIIDNHIDDSAFSVDMLSRKIGISERQLQRKIKEATRKSPSQLIASIRLNKAKLALALRDCSIAEIAFQFGFSSPSYFSKCFKKEFGLSPNEVYDKT